MTEFILVVRTLSSFYEFYKQLLKFIPKTADSIINLKKKIKTIKTIYIRNRQD